MVLSANSTLVYTKTVPSFSFSHDGKEEETFDFGAKKSQILRGAQNFCKKVGKNLRRFRVLSMKI